MPSEEPAPPPSAATVAWNWVIEELAGCKEFDSSIFAALLKWDRSIVADPVYGDRTMECIVLKYLEELAESILPPQPSSASAAAAPPPGSKMLEPTFNADSSSERIMFHLSRELGALNSTGNCVSGSCRDLIRQVILEKRAVLHKSPIDLLKDLMFEHCREGDQSSNIVRCLVGGNQRKPMHTDNTDGYITIAKKLKLDKNHVQQEKLPLSTKSNQGLLLNEAAFRHENQLSQQNVQIGQDDNNACPTRKSVAPEFPVEKDKMPQISSPVKTAPEFHVGDEVIAAETLTLLNSQNPVNNDSLIDDRTQQRSCVKCDDGGQVLICTGSGCPIVVHERCLGVSIGAENPKTFKCPLCLYLAAASAYHKARKKVSVVKERLTSFMTGVKKVQLPTSVVESSHAKKSSNRDHPDKVCINQKGEIEPERQSQAKAPINDDDGNLPGGPGNTLSDRNNSAASSGETKRVNEYHVVSTSQTKDQAVATARYDDHRQHTVPPHKGGSCTESDYEGTRVEHLPGEQDNACVNKICHADTGAPKIMQRDKGSLSHEPVDLCNGLDHAQGKNHQQHVATDSDTISITCQEIHVECEKVRAQVPQIDHDVDQQSSSKIYTAKDSSSNKVKKQKVTSRPKRYTNQILPPSRRNRLPWTSEEEAILKEAMQEFYGSGETAISWIKILEYGRHVFHKTRLPMDLKDKWRNIRMKEG